MRCHAHAGLVLQCCAASSRRERRSKGRGASRATRCRSSALVATRSKVEGSQCAQRKVDARRARQLPAAWQAPAGRSAQRLRRPARQRAGLTLQAAARAKQPHRLEMMPCSQKAACRAVSGRPRTWYASRRPSGRRNSAAPASGGGGGSRCSASSAGAASTASAAQPRHVSTPRPPALAAACGGAWRPRQQYSLEQRSGR